jgi:8-oxo-dGTP pyrophosphatase MutT (NUDIX family)
MKLRPRAEVICFKRNRVLCAFKPDYVCFPGGGIDPKESPIEAAKREAREEAAREVINCTPAHPPTVQLWPEDYAKDKPWSKGHTGGFTYWMTGSTSDNPLPPADRHHDYEADMDWHPIRDVVGRLKSHLTGEWGDDNRVRIAILETHLTMHKEHGSDEKTAEVSSVGGIAPSSVQTVKTPRGRKEGPQVPMLAGLSGIATPSP